MYYEYKLVPMNDRKEMYDVYLLDDGLQHKRCMILREDIRRILDNTSDVQKLDAGQLVNVRLSERKLIDAAKQLY